VFEVELMNILMFLGYSVAIWSITYVYVSWNLPPL
jgi:hypothetical protein